MSRTFFSFAATAALTVAVCGRVAAQLQPLYTCQVTTSGKVNARADPNTDAAITGQFEPNQNLLAVGLDDSASWYQVLLADQSTVWVFGELLTCTQLPTPTAAQQPTLPPEATQALTATQAVAATETPTARLTATQTVEIAAVETVVPPTAVIAAVESPDAGWVLPVTLLIAVSLAAAAVAAGYWLWRKYRSKQVAVSAVPTAQTVAGTVQDYMSGSTVQLPAMGHHTPDQTEGHG